MTVTTHEVRGMTCGHCVSTLKTAVGSVPGVSGVEVDLQAGTVTSTGNPPDHAVAQAIAEAGYDVLTAEHTGAVGDSLPLAGSAGCGCGCG